MTRSNYAAATIAAVILGYCYSTAGQAELIVRGNGMVYDDVLDITWIQDAGMGGNLSWDDAVAWADNLVYEGFDNWRLPSMDVNGDQTVVNCNGATELACRDNELGYMYYQNLMGNSGDDLTGDQGVILNVQFFYWSGTEYSFNPMHARAFDFVAGGQFFDQKIFEYAAWAVRPGDVPVQDSDDDGFIDSIDTCILVANPPQRDTDADGIGNACDPDVNIPNDCAVNFLDLDVYKANFFQAGDLDTDNNGDGLTNFLDLNIVKSFFFGPPGPSASGCN